MNRKLKNGVSTMTLTIDLPDEQTLVLKAKAKAQGVSTEQYARQVLEQDLVPDWLRESRDSARQTGVNQLSMDEIDAEIAAARRARRESRPQPGS
jgi:plasmid stability protein